MIPGVRFEKWQALGNDYVIVERTDVTPETVRHLCDRHLGVGADGVLELSPPDEPGYVARLRIFNPDGSEAELSGNGARQAIMYLRHRGWTEADTFSIQTAAGEIRPTITGPATCRVDMGRASLTSKDYPGGPPDGTGTVDGLRVPARLDRQPAVRDPDRRPRRARAPRPAGDRPGHRARAAVPQPHQHLVLDRAGAGRHPRPHLRARRGETLSSGTGACGAAVAHVLRGGDSPVTVHLDGGELEVDVDESLHIDLTGWAVPVFKGELLGSVEEP